MSQPEAPATIKLSTYGCEPQHAGTEYIRRDIFDAYKKAVDAWDNWLENYHDDYGKVTRLVKAARKAGESVL